MLSLLCNKLPGDLFGMQALDLQGSTRADKSPIFVKTADSDSPPAKQDPSTGAYPLDVPAASHYETRRSNQYGSCCTPRGFDLQQQIPCGIRGSQRVIVLCAFRCQYSMSLLGEVIWMRDPVLGPRLTNAVPPCRSGRSTDGKVPEANKGLHMNGPVFETHGCQSKSHICQFRSDDTHVHQSTISLRERMSS
jgi:hypothetical protein